MQILHLEAGTPFKMGKGQNWRVVHPDMGAKQLTLNHGVHAPGQEFTQHFHDNSEDMIVVLEGGSSVRQGDVYTPVSAREAIFVPVGEVHGTVNDTGKMARLISFQSPPDMALYLGERDHAPNQIPTPKHGHQSAVQIVDMARSGPVFGKSGDWRSVISPERGSKHISLEYIRLSSGEGFEHEPGAAEAIYVLVDGEAEVRTGHQAWNLGAKDVIFLKTEESCSISPVASNQLLTLLHCRATSG